MNNGVPINLSLANSYSGHTLLALFLNSSEYITCLGDTIISTNLKGSKMCSCGEKTANCSLWQHIYNCEYYSNLENSPANNLIYRLSFKYNQLSKIQKLMAQLPTIRTYYESLYKFCTYVKQYTKTDVFVHGSKKIFNMYILALLNVPMRVIHLTKHPIDYAASVKSRKIKGQIQIKEIVKKWVEYNKKVFELKDLSSNCDYIHIRYDDFCNNTQDILVQICSFLEVPFSDTMLQPDNRSQHIVGAASIVKKRFEGLRSPKNPENYLSSSDMSEIKNISEPFASQLGYTFTTYT